MAKKKENDRDTLARIREVISDMNRNFEINTHRSVKGIVKGQVDRLDESLAVQIIDDLLKGKAGTLTRDYLKSKRKSAKATSPRPV